MKKRHVGVDSKNKGSWGQTPGPARRAGRQASGAERCCESQDCIQRAKTQTALPTSSPRSLLCRQRLSTPSPAHHHLRTGSPPSGSCLCWCLLSLTPHRERNKVPRNPSSSFFFLFFLSFFLPRRRVASLLLSLTPRLRSGHYTAEMVCSC